MNRILKVVGVLLCYATLTGPSYGSAQFDPCELLSRDEAATLAGEPVNTPEKKETNNPLGQKMCLYNTESSSRLIQISVVRTADIAPKVKQQGQSAAKIYHTTKEMLLPVESVVGIGDDACWGMPGLHILKGEVYLLVSVGNTSKPENLDLARRIALKVLPRLSAEK